MEVTTHSGGWRSPLLVTADRDFDAKSCRQHSARERVIIEELPVWWEPGKRSTKCRDCCFRMCVFIRGGTRLLTFFAKFKAHNFMCPVFFPLLSPGRCVLLLATKPPGLVYNLSAFTIRMEKLSKKGVVSEWRSQEMFEDAPVRVHPAPVRCRDSTDG